MPALFDKQDFGRHSRTLRRFGLWIEPVNASLRKAVCFQVCVFRLADNGAERRIRDDEVETVFFEAGIAGLVNNVAEWEQPVGCDDIRMPVVVDDHVHLCRAGYLLVDFNAEKTPLRELMPALVCLDGLGSVFGFRCLANLVQGM